MICIKSWQYFQINSNRTQLTGVTKPLNTLLIASLIAWMPLTTHGSYVFNMSAIFLNHVINAPFQGIWLQMITRGTVDISPLIRFHFFKKVYYTKVDCHFPSDSVGKVGHIAGIREHCGHALTCKVLNPDTLMFVYSSLICLATSTNASVCAKLIGGERPDFIHSCDDGHSKHLTTSTPSPIANPNNLIGQIFLMYEQPDNPKFRALVLSKGLMIMAINWKTARLP
jgi:hypothetical protein